MPIHKFFVGLGHDVERALHPLKIAEHWVGGEIGGGVSRVEHLFGRHAGGAGGAVHTTISPTINIHVHGAAPGGFDAKAHAKAVVDIMDRHMARKARLSFGTP